MSTNRCSSTVIEERDEEGLAAIFVSTDSTVFELS